MKYSTLALACIATATTTLLSPSAFAMGGKKPSPTVVGNLTIAADVPENQAKLFAKDLNMLSSMGSLRAHPEVLRLMHLNEVNGSSLQSWLGERVQYVIGEGTQLQKSAKSVQENYSFDNPDEMPDVESASNLTQQTGIFESGSGETKAIVVMSNQGSVLYYIGKANHVLVGLDIAGVGVVPVTSPRTGIIQIGEGHFLPLMRAVGRQEIDTPGNSVERLSTLFHEARHSDGHGKTLSFFHALCPAGHDFEGKNACDRNLNGPYTIGAWMQKTLGENCERCSIEEKEMLTLMSMDSFNRVLRSTPVSARVPSLSDEEATVLRKLCNLYAKYPDLFRDQLQECSSIGLHGPAQEIPSTEWDDAPEGRR